MNIFFDNFLTIFDMGIVCSVVIFLTSTPASLF
ncbi:hypothetical protein DEU42_11441 [Flavobacterium sp. AG291]|nr:hypothetical protein DEU42_11441 [Flavobacterium sp. AG291]